MSTHVPVLTAEVLDALHLKPNGTYLDATIGGGGHTEAILRADPTVSVVGLDRDPAVIRDLEKLTRRLRGRLKLVHASYDQIRVVLERLEIERVDGIIVDLGLSSIQLADPNRSFSYQHVGSFDLRFDPTEGQPTSHWLREQSEAELATILGLYGDLRRPRALAKKILTSLPQHQEFGTPDLVAASGLKAPRQLAKLFQAIRIAVNDELGKLERALPEFLAALAPHGRLAIISFHSGEDRIVKHTFRAWQQQAAGRLITKRPIRPRDPEITTNRRARSAKLRIFES